LIENSIRMKSSFISLDRLQTEYERKHILDKEQEYRW